MKTSNSRRKFLQTSAAAAAVAMSNPLFAAGEGKVVRSVPHASGYGAFWADLDAEGNIVALRPQESDKDPKYPGVQGLVERAFSPTRIKYPCVRKSYLEGKNAPELRGKEEFVRVSWTRPTKSS